MGTKTKIDWCDSTWNPVTGCRHDCAYCYARKIAERFGGVNWHEKLNIFPVFTVYKNPRDFPGKYVVRLFDGTRPMRLITIRDTLDEARATIPEGFYCVQKSPDDDPVIVETWL